MRTWLAGIVSAVIVAAVGVVFTAWFNARGSDTVESISGEPPIKVGHVAVDYAAQDTTLREAVTDPADRAVLLSSASGSRRDTVMARHDRAPLETADLTVVLVGNRSSLRIVDIQPRVLGRKPVSDGALFIYTPPGEAATIELAAYLDKPAPRFTSPEDPNISYFRKKQIDLKRDERVTLSMTVGRGPGQCHEACPRTRRVACGVVGARGRRDRQHVPEGPGPRRVRPGGGHGDAAEHREDPRPAHGRAPAHHPRRPRPARRRHRRLDLWRASSPGGAWSPERPGPCRPVNRDKREQSPNRNEDHIPSANFCTQTPRRPVHAAPDPLLVAAHLHVGGILVLGEPKQDHEHQISHLP
ncbi:hypothetical protein JYK22_40930, partial [Nonomuraea sp. RK-328]|nr:hypothetical protein [Nonomuraea sp. RK-328]